MSKLFEGTEINGMALPNRFVRSATWEGMASGNGSVTPKLISTMVDLVKGGVGLIISSHSYVSPEGQAGPGQLGVYKDGLIPGLKEMTGAVHDCGGKIVMQLAHAGIFSPEKLTGQAPLAGEIVLPCLDVHVERTVDLQDEDATVGRTPLAVGEAEASAAVAPPRLPGGRREPEPRAHPADVDLRHGLCTACDVRECAAEPWCTAERAEPVDPDQELLGRREPLLHSRGEHAFRGAV